jgi:hypothetical protein
MLSAMSAVGMKRDMRYLLQMPLFCKGDIGRVYPHLRGKWHVREMTYGVRERRLAAPPQAPAAFGDLPGAGQAVADASRYRSSRRADGSSSSSSFRS